MSPPETAPAASDATLQLTMDDKLNRLIALTDTFDKRLSSIEGHLEQSDKRLSSLAYEFSEYQIHTPKDRHSLTLEDATSALGDMKETLDSLIALTKQSATWTRADTGTACYLFNSMVEIAWTLITHAASDQQPIHFCKHPITSSSFKPIPRHHDTAPFELKALSGLNKTCPKAAKLLVKHMTAWLPYYSSANKHDIVYNQTGFWLCVLRFARDVGTHRSLCLVQREEPVGVGSSSTATGLKFKVPVNPGVEEYTDSHVGRDAPAFSDMLSFSHREASCGYCYTSSAALAGAIERVAYEVHDGLAGVVADCIPEAQLSGP